MADAGVLRLYIPEGVVVHAHVHHGSVLIRIKLGSNAQEILIVALIHYVLLSGTFERRQLSGKWIGSRWISGW
jgi:hypothetical protein